jgi:hypothetical protein
MTKIELISAYLTFIKMGLLLLASAILCFLFVTWILWLMAPGKRSWKESIGSWSVGIGLVVVWILIYLLIFKQTLYFSLFSFFSVESIQFVLNLLINILFYLLGFFFVRQLISNRSNQSRRFDKP